LREREGIEEEGRKRGKGRQRRDIGRGEKGEKRLGGKEGGEGMLVRVASANLAGSIDEGMVNKVLCCQ